LGVVVANIYPTCADTNLLNVKSFGSTKVELVPEFMIEKPESVIRGAFRGIAKRRVCVYAVFRARFY